MPPRRRKLSTEDSDKLARDVKRLATETCVNAEPESKLTGVSEKCLEPSERDGRKTKTKIGILTPETKVKTPKPTRISERLIIKRNRLGDAEENENQSQVLANPHTTPRKPKTARQTGKLPGGGKKNKRRPWVLWSVQDKKLFFLGLGEHGKNFQAISNKIAHSAKMHGHPVKDKMQVKYFYYRCLAKISKFMDLNEQDVKRKTQELYGLINYGVLRKHVKENDPQFGKCLNELIHQGETTYTMKSVKGKKTRVGKLRTPICTYLKKINKIEERQASEASTFKIPQQITLELTPKNSRAWAKVQGMSHNPRVRIKVASHRTLESVFLYLENKWKEHRVRFKEKLGVSEEPEEELFFYLHPNFKLVPVSFIPQEPQKVDVSFTNYKEHVLPTLRKPRKPRATKESDRPGEDRDKTEDKPVDGDNERLPSITDSSEQAATVKDSSSPALPDKVGSEPPSALAHLLAAAAGDMATFCKSDITSVASTGGQNVLADVAVGPTLPTVLMEDENAMFPDSSSFSPPACSVSDILKPSVIPSSPSSSSSSSPHSSTVVPSVILSPSVSRKKSSKSSKKTVLLDDAPSENCDNPGIVPVSDISSSPAKNEGASLQDLKGDSEKEVARLSTLAADGFTQRTSNTVTLFHLSIVLGRESIIRLEYEWKPKKLQKAPLPPLLFQNLVANQMSNVLRRLCNLATLELTDFSSPVEKVVDQNKPPKKNMPCSQCGREGSPKTKSKKRLMAERKESTREISTMTDPLRLEPVPISQMLHPAAVGGRTYVAGPATSGTLSQMNGPDPVFRVPFIPSPKPVMTREEHQRLEEQQQRIQQQAKAIMQQAPTRNRLLKKRTLNPRSRKPPPIIVQRTLLPKVDSGQMVTFIQQPGSQPVSGSVMVGVNSDSLVKFTHSGLNVVTTSAQPKVPVSISQVQTADLMAKPGPTDILALATQSAEITASSVISHEKMSSPSLAQTLTSDVDTDRATDAVEFSDLSVVTTRITYSGSASAEMVSPALSAQGDLSISDFDISMSSVTGSTCPDSGDKFLDMVLHNSEQGFSGLICTSKSSSESCESCEPYPPVSVSTSGFDSSFLHTPNHSSTVHSPISTMYSSPLKLPDQPWPSGMSSFLGDTTLLNKDEDKSTSSGYSVFFDTGSSDIPQNGGVIFSKAHIVSDISLSSLLGDSTFKKISPLPLASNAAKSSPVEEGLFSEVGHTEGAPQLFSEASQDSFSKLDVDGTLQGMVNDSSLDLVSKFESLAAHITETASLGERQDKLTGETTKLEHIIRLESSSTAS